MNQVTVLKKTLTKHVERVDNQQRPLDFHLIMRLAEFTAPFAAQRNTLLFVVFLRSIQLPALTWLLAAVINGPIARSDIQGVIIGSIAFAVLAIFTQITMYYRQYLSLQLGESVVGELRKRLFSHLQTLRMSWFHKTKVGRVISRMTSDIEDIRVGVQEVLFITMVQLGQMVFAAIAMLWYDWMLFMLVLAMAPILWVINHYFHRLMSRSLRDMRESFSRVTATLAESVTGIRVTQAFVRQEENARIFGDLAADHSAYNTVVLRTQGTFLPLLELNSQIFIVLLMLVGGYRVLSPESHMAVGDLVGFFLMSHLFFSPILVMGNQYNLALTAMAGAERYFKLLDTKPEWTDAADARDLPEIQGRVEFRNVTFGYDPQRPVLHEVNFVAEPGQVIALVGHTGSGKSSIINLVSKFYLPQSGEILIDGTPLGQVASDSLHRQMGVVLQQNFLFYGTVRENIQFGKPDATDEQIVEVLRQLGCEDLLNSLPQGLDTQVGERGGTLSSGQRQIVCFARAMIADPRILILDEATSSIDSATESRLQHALSILTAGRTSFVVAHRLSTIRHADQVLVLDHGHIVERGRHHELLAQKGVYFRLHQRFVQQTADLG